MKAELRGLPELEKELNRRFGKAKMQRVSDDALYRGAQVYVKAIKREMSSRPNKGYAKGWSNEDITISEPMWIGGARTVKIHWNGPHGRHRIIHLNEFGTVNNPNPPRKGAIAVALRAAESEYKAVIKSALEGAM